MLRALAERNEPVNPSRFNEITLRKFKFLEVDYGFNVTRQATDIIEYRSSAVLVAIVYDQRRSSELDLNERKIGELREFSLGEVTRALGVELNIVSLSPSVTNEAALERFLGAFSEILMEHGKSVLEEEKMVFSQLDAQRERECEVYELETALSQARARLGKIKITQILSAF